MDWQVVFYVDEDGNEAVKDFILRQPKGAIAEIIDVLKLLREFDIRLSSPYVRKIDRSGIRELRIRHSSDSYRVFFFAFVGRKFVLLHAITKKGDRIPEGDKAVAIRRMYDHMSRHADERD